MIFGRKNFLAGLFLSVALLGAWTSAWSQGKFLYVANIGCGFNTVGAFAIDAATGALFPAPGSPFTLPGGGCAVSLAVDPSGRFVYVADSHSNWVAAFTINAASGTLTPVPGSPFPAGTGPASVTVEPSGQFVYVTNIDSNNVSAFIINGATGALTLVPGSPFSLFPTTRPRSRTALYPQPMMAVDPSGQFLFVTNTTGPVPGALPGSNDVSAFRINAASGVLTPVPGSPFPTGRSPGPVAVHPSGHFLYVWNVFIGTAAELGIPSNVSVYTIDATTGALTEIVGSPFPPVPSQSRVQAVAMHPSGQFMYAVDDGFNAVSEYSIDQTTGAPTKVRDFTAQGGESCFGGGGPLWEVPLYGGIPYWHRGLYHRCDDRRPDVGPGFAVRAGAG